MPPCSRILLIKSGSRHLIEYVLPKIRTMFGEQVEIDLVTCYQGEPEGFEGQAFRLNDFGGPSGREKLLADLTARGYTVAGIICAAEPIMTKWK